MGSVSPLKEKGGRISHFRCPVSPKWACYPWDSSMGTRETKPAEGCHETNPSCDEFDLISNSPFLHDELMTRMWRRDNYQRRLTTPPRYFSLAEWITAKKSSELDFPPHVPNPTGGESPKRNSGSEPKHSVPKLLAPRNPQTTTSQEKMGHIPLEWLFLWLSTPFNHSAKWFGSIGHRLTEKKKELLRHCMDFLPSLRAPGRNFPKAKAPASQAQEFCTTRLARGFWR